MGISNIKVLLLNVNRSGWHSGNMIYDMEAISRACDTKIYGPGYSDYKHTNIEKIIAQLYGEGKPDIIYSYFTPNEKVRDVYKSHYKISDDLMVFPTNWDCLKSQKLNSIIKIFALSDFWSRNSKQYSKDLQGNPFSYCFCCFAPPYSNPKNFFAFFDDNIKLNMKFIGYPRCVDDNCFKDYGLNKKYDIITAGAMWHFYPMRSKIHNFLNKNSANLNIKYKNYPHCGVDFSHSDFVRERYAMAINESKMMASCGGRYHVAMNKIFESMGCGTVYVGEKPYGEKELGLREDWNYISVTFDNFMEKIKYYLEHDKDREIIVANAKDTFKKRLTIDVRANDFVKLIEDL